MNSRLDRLYDTNEPGIRNLAETCDIYLNVYSKLKNNIIVTNSALTSWYNTWIIQYDGETNDPSLNDIYSVNKNIFKDLQDILKNQYTFFYSVKSSRLPNGDCICFKIDLPNGVANVTNQTRDIRARFNLGTVSNLGLDISTSNVIDTRDTTQDLSSNHFLVKHYYQIGTFALEKIEIDTYFGFETIGSISSLYKKIIGSNSDCCSGTDGVEEVENGNSIIEKNNRLIEQLVFSINMINDLKKMLTYFT
jgi:hypothetical protein